MQSNRTLTEVRHLLWLQGKLIRSSLRSGSRQDTVRLIGIGLLALLMVPGVLGFNGLLVWVYRSLDVQAASELVAVIFSFLILSWLLTPASNQQLVEPFSMPKLFQHPISLRGLIAGSLAVNMLGLGFLISIPFALAVVAGLSRSLEDVPLIFVASLLFLASLIVLKSLLDDVFDLIAEDRRLRSIAILLALLPVIIIFGGQLWLQSSFMPGSQDPAFEIESVTELNQAIAGFRVSRFLIWQPGGWMARAAEAAATNDYLQWLLWTGLLLAFVVIGFVLHYNLLRRLYFGELARVQARRQSSGQALGAAGIRLLFVSPQTAEAFWGMLKADWRGFTRNPYTVRMAITPVMLGLMAVFVARMTPMPAPAAGAMLGATSVMIMTLSYGHNIFGILDSPGFATVLLAPVPPRLLLLSHNVLLTAIVLLLAVGVGVFLAVFNQSPWAIATTVGGAIALHLPMLAVCNLTAVYFPYKLDLEKGRAAANEGKTSALGVFGVMFGAALLAIPVLLLVLLPLLLWKPGLIAGIPGALVYVAIIYGASLAFAGRAMEKRSELILAAISLEA